MARRACLAIGVATVLPEQPNQATRFAYLDGAILAARAIGQWAISSGFGADNVRVVDDGRVGGKDNPVTRERVQKAVNELFPKGADDVEQLLLGFCGHGLTDANFNSISWLFSDALQSRYRVIADAFQEELLRQGVQRITLITDACREAPKDIDLLRLQAERGITMQGRKVESPMFDLFAACQDGQLGFMVSVPNSAMPGKCIFSGVVADLLWGLEKAAFDKFDERVITTASFGTCVRTRTKQRAKQDYGLDLIPMCRIDPEAAVLYDKQKPPQGPPDLQPWPPATNAVVAGTSVAEGAAPGDASRNLERVLTDARFRKQILGPSFGMSRSDRAVPTESLTIPDASKDLLQDLVTLRNAPSRGKFGVPGKQQKVDALVQRLEADATADARKRAAGAVRRSLIQIKPSAEPDGSNVIVVGDEPLRLWSGDPVELHKRTSARTGFRVRSDTQGTPILVELSDGAFTPVVPYGLLYAVVTKSAAGDVLQVYGQPNSHEAFKTALEAIADFAAGRIGPERVDELAAGMRYGKHADPALGAICAYLYRAIADFDSIRRMAYFYAKRQQAVPFDIALLGAMKVTRKANGATRLDVPAVKARKRRKGQPDFVTAATSAAQAGIGGRCPWLGLGWDYVGMPRPEWAALVDGLAEHAPEIRRSGFTVLPSETGRALAKSWGLEPRWPE
jgi:hypothetical protein